MLSKSKHTKYQALLLAPSPTSSLLAQKRAHYKDRGYYKLEAEITYTKIQSTFVHDKFYCVRNLRAT